MVEVTVRAIFRDERGFHRPAWPGTKRFWLESEANRMPVSGPHVSPRRTASRFAEVGQLVTAVGSSVRHLRRLSEYVRYMPRFAGSRIAQIGRRANSAEPFGQIGGDLSASDGVACSAC